MHWSDLRRSSSLKAIVRTIAALLVPVGLPHISLAGLNQGMPHFAALGNSVTLDALDVWPLTIVCLYVEALRMIAAPLTRLANLDPKFGTIDRLIVPFILGVAAIAAWDLARSFEDIQASSGAWVVALPGWLFGLSVVTTLLAVTALLVWLAAAITKYGVGAGFWLLVVTPQLGELAKLASQQGFMSNAAAGYPVGLVLAFYLLALVAFVWIDQFACAQRGEPSPVLLDPWPALIAAAAMPSIAQGLAYCVAGKDELAAGYFLQSHGAGTISYEGAFGLTAAIICLYRAIVFNTSRRRASAALVEALPFSLATGVVCTMAGVMFTKHGLRLSGDGLVPLLVTAIFVVKRVRSCAV